MTTCPRSTTSTGSTTSSSRSTTGPGCRATTCGGPSTRGDGWRTSTSPSDRRPRPPGATAPWWQIYQPPYDEELHSTNFVAERTTAFIEEASGQGRPWMVKASFPDPHHPMTPPGRWFDRHDPADMELPATIDDPLDGAPAHLKRFQRFTPLKQRNFVAPCGATDPQIVRQAIAATYGMIELIDDAVGRILATVDRVGAGEDTVVVFTSDHGDMMGDHGLLLKGFMHYRGTLQVPLVIKAPGRMPGRTAALASTLDLCPTILDLVGLRPFQGIQGRSLGPVLADPAAVVRRHVLIEDDLPSAELTGSFVPAKTRTVVTDRARYTRNSKGEEQLFDLEADHDELADLSGLDDDLGRRDAGPDDRRPHRGRRPGQGGPGRLNRCGRRELRGTDAPPPGAGCHPRCLGWRRCQTSSLSATPPSTGWPHSIRSRPPEWGWPEHQDRWPDLSPDGVAAIGLGPGRDPGRGRRPAPRTRRPQPAGQAGSSIEHCDAMSWPSTTAATPWNDLNNIVSPHQSASFRLRLDGQRVHRRGLGGHRHPGRDHRPAPERLAGHPRGRSAAAQGSDGGPPPGRGGDRAGSR